MQKGFAHIYILLGVIVLISLGGLYYLNTLNPKQINPTEPRNPKEVYEANPKLDTWLYDLATAKTETDRKALKTENVIGDQVRVEIEVFDPSFNLAPEFGTEEVRAENRIQAKIYINKLLQLAEDPKVRSIQEPIRGYPAN